MLKASTVKAPTPNLIYNHNHNQTFWFGRSLQNPGDHFGQISLCESFIHIEVLFTVREASKEQINCLDGSTFK